jgi:gliding motility-associated-like protein
MLKKLSQLVVITILLGLSPNIAKASHIAGGEITYNCLGGNQYEINLNLFVDCLGFDPGASQFISFTSTCGGTASLTVNGTNPGGTEISQLCPAQIPNSTCNGGTLPGMWIFSYTGIVTLTPPCDTWTASWSTCCRNLAITNLSSASSNYYIEATMNTATAPCNSSPAFTAQPIPYVCVGQTVNYSYGVVETDGDSLYYSLIPAMDNATTNSTYNAGYSGTSPIPGITIDPVTGLVTFTPSAVGNFVVVILVEEYDANGNLIGTVMRDIQFVVQNCTNIVPDPTGGQIANFGGSAVQTGPYAIEMCAGNSFTFDATYTDTNPTDVLTYITNLSVALPGATITSSGTNPLTISVSWTAPGTMAGTNVSFSITVQDGACPIQGQQTFVYNVDILDATTTNPDITICGTQSAQLTAYGGSIFNWSVVSGDPMTAANFSCNPCNNPVATPSVTTTYAVVSNLSGTCDNNDTVTVYVVPGFSYMVTQSSANSCLQDPIQLNVTALSPAGAYTFDWTPGYYLSDSTTSNPVATFIAPGTYNYNVTITSSFGCVQTGAVSIYAAPAFAPQIDGTGDTALCAGASVNLGVEFTGGGTPATCGLSVSGGCNGTSIAGTVGNVTGANTSTTWPAPYGNWYTSAKHQFLFTAAELNAAGIVGGKIDQLDFEVTAINGITTYHQYTIKMGCTAVNALGTTWEGGLVQVFNPKNVNVIVGWNTHVFDNAFEWDGLSNVIVEICFTEGPPYSNFTTSCITPWTTTAFTSCLYSFTDSFDMCPDLTNWITATNNRPVVRFHYCSIASDPADFTYQWTAIPAPGGITNPTSQYTTATPTGITDYVITVTNIAGGCSSTDTVHIDAINVNTLAITPAGPYCVNGVTDTLETSVPVGIGTWSGPGITDVNLGIFDPAAAGVGTHEIFYNVNGTCGTGVDSTDIVVIPQPDATINPVSTQCITGGTITLTAVDGGGTWTGTGITDATLGTFDPAIAGVGTFTITYTITTPCFSQATTSISVVSQLDATITPVGPFCTAAPSITMAAVDAGGTWSGPGITDATLGTFDPATAGPGSHTITYSITGLCGATSTTVINVIASPVISFTSNVTQGCEPTTVSFLSTVDQPGGTYSWTFGNGDVSSLANPTITYTTAGSYDVNLTYSNNIGCSTTLNQVGYITIHSQPLAQYSAGPQPTSIAMPTVNFSDNSTGVIDTWLWTFGTGDSSTVQNPVYTYADSGSYPIQLIVTNNNGCSDTAYGTVVIDPIMVFYAPTAFTPDGNGINDEFTVKADGVDHSTFEMRIFNRWGEMIFISKDIYKGWNGAKMNIGALVEEDVYVWKVNFKDFKGLPRQYIGHVTIIK